MINYTGFFSNKAIKNCHGLKTHVSSLFNSFLSQIQSSLVDFTQFSEGEIFKKPFLGSFHQFRLVVWRQKFGMLSREELCAVTFPAFWDGEVKGAVLEDWHKELIYAWEKLIRRYPTFVLYFPDGVRFSMDSLAAFSKALKNLEEKEVNEGVATKISLFLGDNAVGDEGAKILAQALNILHACVHLDIKNNEIGGAGAIALAEALRENTTLKVLDLSGNPISEEGVIAIAEALRINRSLKCLTLSTETVTVPAARIFEDVCQENKTIEHLDIWR